MGRPATTSEAMAPRRYHAPPRNEPRYYDERDYGDYDDRGHDYYNERSRDYYNERDQDVYSYSRNDPVGSRLDRRYNEGDRRGWDSREINNMREDQAFVDREDRTERRLRDFQRIATTTRSYRDDDDFDLRRDFEPERKSFRARDDIARGYSNDYYDRHQDQSYNSKRDSDGYQRYGRNFDEDDDFDQEYQDKRNNQRPMRRRPVSDAGRGPRGAVSESGRSPPQRALSESSRRLPPRAQSDSGRVKSSRASDGEQYKSSRRPVDYSDGLSVHSAPAGSSNGKSAVKHPRPSSERSRKAALPRVDESNEDYGSHRGSRSMEDFDFESRGRGLRTVSSERGYYEGSQRETSRSRNMNGSTDPGTVEDFGNSRKRASSQRAQDRDNGTKGSLEAKIAVAHRKLEDSSRNLAIAEERLAEAQEEVQKHKENHGSRAVERQLMDALRRARDKCKDSAAAREADAAELQTLEDQSVRENEKLRTPKTRRK